MNVDYLNQGKVVSIQPRRTQVHFPSISQVETYWEGLRDGRLMPTRAELNPRGIANALEFAFVLEKVAPGLARFRLAGMHLNDLMNMEVRGMPITAMFLPEARREMQKVIEDVMDSPAIVRLTLTSESGMGRPPLDAQMILMPLRDDTGKPTRILGALQANGEIGRGPRRFMIRDRETKELLTDPLTARRRYEVEMEKFNITEQEPKPQLQDVTGMEEEKQPFLPKTQAMARQIEEMNKMIQDRTQRRKEVKAKLTGKTEEVPAKKGGHLRLVHDADRM